MAQTPGILARGPWAPAQVEAVWRNDEFAPAASATQEADAAVAALRERGSPSHDGLAARLAGYETEAGRLRMELQPARWALRLLAGQASSSLAVLCLVRDPDGCWLAGRRAAWLASLPGRWALGAGGSVEVDEHPVHAMSRELLEEWSVEPRDLSIEALLLLPTGLAVLVGHAWLPEGAAVTPDAEHDEFAWWPSSPAEWPEHADEPWRRMATLLAATP